MVLQKVVDISENNMVEFARHLYASISLGSIFLVNYWIVVKSIYDI